MSQSLPWYDNPNRPYPGNIVLLWEMWDRDAELGRELTQAPWIIDGINQLEDDAVWGLGHIYDRDPALARRLLAYTMEEPVQDRNTMFLGNLNEMLLNGHTDKFESLIAQPWFVDGLNAEERAFITVATKTTGIDALYNDLLTSPRITRTATVSLPLAGEVNLWVFHNDSRDEDLLPALERGVRDAERIMGTPFPRTDLIVLSLNVDDYDIGYGAVNWVDSMTLLWTTKRHMEEYVVYHEIAHFWLTAEVGPFWFHEGGAEFISQYVSAGDGPVVQVENALRYCRDIAGVRKIHALGDPNHPDPLADVSCAYLIGEYFLIKLFNAMGEAAFSSVMREMYELYLDYVYYQTDEQVYRIFLKHTPPDREAAVIGLWRQIHGGPFIDES